MEQRLSVRLSRAVSRSVRRRLSRLAALELLSRQPNTWYKLLSIGHDSRGPYPFRDLWLLYQRAVAWLGPQRIVFGTDFPYVRDACPYAAAIDWLSELPFLDDAARA